MNSLNRGIGMTSQRTRDRLVARLRDEGIRNEAVLDVIRNTPRHLFVDEALASRAYEEPTKTPPCPSVITRRFHSRTWLRP